MNDSRPPRTITTMGVGRASTSPDTAVLTLGVEQQAATPSEALSACSASANAVLDAVSEHVTDPDAVQTSDLSVHPNYDHRSDRPQGYAARTTLTVRTSSIDTAGALATTALAAAGDAGQIHGLSLIAEDTLASADEARAAAFADARRKAEQYATLAGASLGELLHLSETGAAGHPQRFGAVALAASAGPPPVEPGEARIALSVTAVWALAD